MGIFKTSFIAQNMFYFGKSMMWTWEMCIFFFCVLFNKYQLDQGD